MSPQLLDVWQAPAGGGAARNSEVDSFSDPPSVFGCFQLSLGFQNRVYQKPIISPASKTAWAYAFSGPRPVLKLLNLRDELQSRNMGYLLKSWTCPTANPLSCNPCGIHSGADDSWGYLNGGKGWEVNYPRKMKASVAHDHSSAAHCLSDIRHDAGGVWRLLDAGHERESHGRRCDPSFTIPGVSY